MIFAFFLLTGAEVCRIVACLPRQPQQSKSWPKAAIPDAAAFIVYRSSLFTP
jgi:hypothetical protein